MGAKLSPNLTILFDTLAAVGLVAALGVVSLVDQAMQRKLDDHKDGTLEVVEVTDGKGPIVRKDLRLAVTPPVFDDMGKLLDGLGKGYKYDVLPLETLDDPAVLKPYNVVFFTCGDSAKKWLGKKVGTSERGGDIYDPNLEMLGKLRDSLRTFVSNGGTLYASDLRLAQVGFAFQEFVVSQPERGKKQTVKAEVVTPELVKLLGPTVTLGFDQPEWYSAPFGGKGCEVLLKGQFENLEGKQCESPLMVRFPLDKGTVIFTSFHNEKTQSEIAEKLLRFLVFSAVMAESESFVTKQSAKDGFKASPGALIGTPKVGQPSEHGYDCSGSPARLRFALTLPPGSGARLRLRIVDPQGRFFEKEITSTFLGDVRSPADGHWTYSVTPLELPYENFVFTVSVSEKVKE